MQIGQKGVKYGLSLPCQNKQNKKQKLSAFAHGDSDDEDVNQQIVKHNISQRNAKKWKQQQAQALAQDPTVFQFDEVYDDMKAADQEKTKQQKIQHAPKYIAGIIDKKEERDRWNSIVYERRLAKDREKEEEEFGDKEAFVTQAYKLKREEDKKLQLRYIAQEVRDKTKAADKVGHMGNFYKNLMTKNQSFGKSKQKSTDEPTDLESQEQLQEEHDLQPNPIEENEQKDDKNDQSQDEQLDQAEKEGKNLGMDHEVSLRLAEYGRKNLVPLKPGVDESEKAEILEKKTSAVNKSSVATTTKQSQDSLLSAKERYLARKRAREQEKNTDM